MRRGLMDKRMGLGFISDIEAGIDMASDAWDTVSDWWGNDDNSAKCVAYGRVDSSGAHEAYECQKGQTRYTCPQGYKPVRTSVFHSGPKDRLNIRGKSIAGRVCIKATTPNPCMLPGVAEKSSIFHPSPKKRIVGSSRPDGGVIRNGRACLYIERPTMLNPNQSVQTLRRQQASTAGVSGDSVLPVLALGAAVLYFATKG